MPEPRFLILGSNSFSGASFCYYLAERGFDVLATSRSPEPHIAFLPYKWGASAENVRFHQIDINHDLEKLQSLLEREKPTHIVNFAAQSMVGQSWEHPEHWMMTNVVSTVSLHNLLRRYEALEKYVHVTTPEVYGSTDGWIKEHTHYAPSTPYAVSRAACDMSVKTFCDQYGFPAVATRAANVYGPGQQFYRIIPRTVLAGMTGQKLTLDGGGASVRVFIHMDDVSNATLKLALEGAIGETFHVSGYELVSIRQCVELVLEKLGKDFDSCVEIGPERPGKDTAYTLDSEKLRDAHGWADEISISQGIDDVIAWMKSYENVLGELPSSYTHKP